MQEREILFRGKRVDTGEWVTGASILDCTIENEKSVYIISSNSIGKCSANKYGTINNLKAIMRKIIPETRGEYTGLTDKNGVKIFEGDILHFKAYLGGGFVCPIGTDIYYRVLFGNCNPDMNTLTEYVGFWALGENYDEDDLYECGKSISYLVNSHGACVIGNIHDNPELIKE